MTVPATLRELAPGATATVKMVGGEGPTARRLMEMGLLPGTRVEMIRAAPMGDPLEIRLRGYLLSLRRAEAQQITLSDSDVAAPEFPGQAAERVVGQRHAQSVARDDDGAQARVPRVLIAGNPNAGKTTLFNALSGARAQVGNYPGVTVTRLSRRIELSDGAEVDLVDLPGTYSLTARSLEEEVAVDAVLGRRAQRPDAVIVTVDASAMERGLYLVQQVVETGVPVVVALNMIDEARDSGIQIDAERLGDWLGATVVPTVASKRQGMRELLAAVAKALHSGWCVEPSLVLPTAAQADVENVERTVRSAGLGDTPAQIRFWALWSILSASQGDETDDVTTDLPASVVDAVHSARASAKSAGRNIGLEIIGARYRHIEASARAVRRTTGGPIRVRTDRIDAVLTHRVYGFAVFGIVMALLFEALFTGAGPAIDLIGAWTAKLQGLVTSSMGEGMFRDLLVEGIIAGVGNVVVFVPQIAMLFLFLAVLEDLGYLARVAFVIDRLMGRVGLHGKAFVPMLSGFACAVPAVMATRTIESRRDRLITMITLPLISCSARLPVYVLISAVIFPRGAKVWVFSLGAVVLFCMYALSVVAALGAAAVLRRTVLKGKRLPLVLELPPYRMPVPRNLLLVTWRRVKRFLVDAGTIILAMTIILWAALTFPHSDSITARYDAERAAVRTTVVAEKQEQRIADLDSLERSEQLRHSIGGRVGRAIEPAIEPLGFDWRIGVGIIGAFAAREVFVSTMGIVFGIEEADEESSDLKHSLRAARLPDGGKLMTPLAGVSLMVFFVLACQCMSTIVVVRTESGSWRWPLLMVGYMSVLAYGAALVVYQVGRAMGWGIT